MLCITSNKGICNVRFWSFLMHRACRLRGDWVWKRTSPLPKDWHIPGESWSDCWCLWWYCLNNGFKTGSYLKFQKWPVAQLSTRKSCKVSTDARNPLMKVKWDIKMLLEKSLRLILNHRPSTYLKRSLSMKVKYNTPLAPQPRCCSMFNEEVE